MRQYSDEEFYGAQADAGHYDPTTALAEQIAMEEQIKHIEHLTASLSAQLRALTEEIRLQKAETGEAFARVRLDIERMQAALR